MKSERKSCHWKKKRETGPHSDSQETEFIGFGNRLSKDGEGEFGQTLHLLDRVISLL